MGMTRDKMEFAAVMSKHTSATLRDMEALCRYGATYNRLAVDQCNREWTERDEAKRERIKAKILAICKEIGAKGAVFSNDPRGCTVKIVAAFCAECGHVESDHKIAESGLCSLGDCPCKEFRAFTNDWGREGICVPTA